jgi:hypothetical protein
MDITGRVKAGEHQDLSTEYKYARCSGQGTTLLLHLVEMAPKISVSLTLYFSNILIYTNKLKYVFLYSNELWLLQNHSFKFGRCLTY